MTLKLMNVTSKKRFAHMQIIKLLPYSHLMVSLIIFLRAVPLYYIHGTGGENKIPYFVATTLQKIMTIY